MVIKLKINQPTHKTRNLNSIRNCRTCLRIFSSICPETVKHRLLSIGWKAATLSCKIKTERKSTRANRSVENCCCEREKFIHIFIFSDVFISVSSELSSSLVGFLIRSRRKFNSEELKFVDPCWNRGQWKKS